MQQKRVRVSAGVPYAVERSGGVVVARGRGDSDLGRGRGIFDRRWWVGDAAFAEGDEDGEQEGQASEGEDGDEGAGEAHGIFSNNVMERWFGVRRVTRLCEKASEF